MFAGYWPTLLCTLPITSTRYCSKRGFLGGLIFGLWWLQGTYLFFRSLLDRSLNQNVQSIFTLTKKLRIKESIYLFCVIQVF